MAALTTLLIVEWVMTVFLVVALSLWAVVVVWTIWTTVKDNEKAERDVELARGRDLP